MLRIDEKRPLEQLRTMSVHLKGDFKEGQSAALLRLDNENGRGRIFTYEMVKGLSVRCYDINFNKDLSFRIGGGADAPIYMLYCLEGHYFHKFSEESEAQRISRGQNVILSARDNDLNVVTLPKKINLKLSVIIIEKARFPKNSIISKTDLDSIIDDLYLKVRSKGRFRHFGGVNSTMDQYVRVLMDNERTDVLGRLVTRAAVLNTMAAQLDTHEKNLKGQQETSPLSDSELERILKLVKEMQLEMHEPHTIQLFSKDAGISPKKLQMGFRFLFGASFAQFLKKLRLEMARELLETTGLQVSQIAHEVGIASNSHLSKIFKEAFGLLPRDYRESVVNASRMFEVSYRSSASPFVSDSELLDLTQRAEQRNVELDVSGCLVFYENNFFQILEGPKKNVLTVFNDIKNDKRHSDVEIIWKGPRDKRIFSNTGMMLLSDRSPQTDTSTGRSLAFDMRTLILDSEFKGLTSRMFWQRIRNRILTSKVA